MAVCPKKAPTLPRCHNGQIGHVLQIVAKRAEREGIRTEAASAAAAAVVA